LKIAEHYSQIELDKNIFAFIKSSDHKPYRLIKFYNSILTLINNNNNVLNNNQLNYITKKVYLSQTQLRYVLKSL